MEIDYKADWKRYIVLANKNEQQKIADCLTSLDELIASQTQKLDALNAHKKGLMEQLFPAEGETLPELRFPEFRDKGEWEKRELRKLVVIINEKAGNNKFTPMSISGGLGLVSQREKFGREIAGAQYKNYYVIRKNDFAYNKSATKEYPGGCIAIYSGKDPAAVPNSIFTCFKVCDENVSPQYLNYLFLGNLHGKWLRKYIMVGARVHGSLNVDNENLLSLPVPLPLGESSLNEQQKIADCLSSLDEVITAQTQKLGAFKAYKKGLMQKLFPAMDAVD
jgi:type I restriction enzyme S subunit